MQMVISLNLIAYIGATLKLFQKRAGAPTYHKQDN